MILPAAALVEGVLPDAVFLVDKPKGWTSFDAIRRLRGMLGVRKLGHAGTLDPLATGLLICCGGRLTKRVGAYQGMPKTYTATVRLGATTASYDAATPEADLQTCEGVTRAMVEGALARFRGTIMQVPPAFAALKVGGRRAYTLARRGEVVVLPARPVTIHGLTLTGFDLPTFSVEVVCSKGTYIRSLAHDLGRALGVGAYLADLRREAIGGYRVADALLLHSSRGAGAAGAPS